MAELLKRKLKTVAPFLIFGVIYMLAFRYIEGFQAPHYLQMEIPFDHQIPFVPEFIIAYLGWFAWIPFVCAYALFADEAVYRKASRILMLGMGFFVIFSLLFPTKLHLRPETVAETNIFCTMVKNIYKADTPTNVFPSIHVYNTIVLLYAIFIGESKLFRNIIFRIFAVLVSASICLSTVFLKQHSVLDVIGAFAMLLVIVVLYDAFKDRAGRFYHSIIRKPSTETEHK